VGQGIFEYEVEMVDVLSTYYPSQYFHGRRWARKFSQISEVTVGSVVPDLVCIALPKTYHRDSTHYHPEFDTIVISDLLKNGHSTAWDISRRIFARETTIKKSLERLYKKSTVAKVDLDCFKLIRKTILYDYHIVSIEAKLTNWRTALKQAINYRDFSHMSYIALPIAIASKDIVVEHCRAEEIGLISVERDSTNVLFKPKPHRPNSSKWIWLLSKTVGIM
jgi:predicted transcriptional regulator